MANIKDIRNMLYFKVLEMKIDKISYPKSSVNSQISSEIVISSILINYKYLYHLNYLKASKVYSYQLTKATLTN